jgi:hypothetical protein
VTFKRVRGRHCETTKVTAVSLEFSRGNFTYFINNVMARLIRVSLAGMHFNYSGAASAFALLAINSHFSRCGSVDRISRRHSALAVRF